MQPPVRPTSAAFIYLGRFVMRVPVQKRGTNKDAREGMPKYYFFVRSGGHISHNSDAVELPDIGAVLEEATKSTGELLRELAHPIEPGTEWRMEVANETRQPLLSLRIIAELFHE
jgi:hypothetical protein